MTVVDAFKSTVRGLMPPTVRRRRLVAFFDREIAGGGERELSQLGRLVGHGELCVDVGCNLGVYAYALSRLGCRVIAIEPIPDLVRIIQDLDLPGVQVLQLALADNDGTAELRIPVRANGHGQATLRTRAFADSAVNAISVSTRRLDSLGLDRVALIKIDVEGYEEQVLAGAMETIDRDRPALLIEIEEFHNEGGLARISRQLAAKGYHAEYCKLGKWNSMKSFDPAIHHVPGDYGFPGNVRPRDYVNNFLFLPAGRSLVENS